MYIYNVCIVYKNTFPYLEYRLDSYTELKNENLKFMKQISSLWMKHRPYCANKLTIIINTYRIILITNQLIYKRNYRENERQ